MAKDFQYKEKEDKFLTKEFWAVMLMVFSLLCFLPLVCGKFIFYDVGLIIQHFILGVLGYVSYPLFITLFIVGYKVLFDKKFITGFKKVLFLGCWLVFLLVLSLVTCFKYPSDNMQISEYLQGIFISGKLGSQEVICSGVILGIPVYFICNLLSQAIAIVVLVLLLVFVIFGFGYKLIKMPKVKIVDNKDGDVEKEEQPKVQPIVKFVDIPNTSNDNQSNNPRKVYNGYDLNKYGFEPSTRDAYTPNQAAEILFNTKNIEKTELEPDTSYDNSSSNVDYTNIDYSGGIKENFGDRIEQSNQDIFKDEDLEDAINDPTIPDFNTVRVDEKIQVSTPKPIKPVEKIIPVKENIVPEKTYSDDGPKLDEFEPKDDPAVNITSVSDSNLIENMPIRFNYKAPPVSILDEHNDSQNLLEFETFKKRVEESILMVCSHHKVNTQVVKVYKGPAVSRFVLSVPMDGGIKSITSLEEDINLRIAAYNHIRMLAPIPGTEYVGIEVENPSRENVYLRDIFSSCRTFINPRPKEIRFLFGKNMVGEPVSFDIRTMPHCLVSGTTGSGKSVCVNTMICSLIMRYSPEELRFVIVDPKFCDFVPYQNMPHMMFNHVVGNDIPLINSTLQWVIDEMERRFKFMSSAGVRKIYDYNEQAKQTGKKLIPCLVVVVDEFAEISVQDKQGGITDKITRIASKARAADIHLVLATQRPSSDIIQGTIKANLGARYVFKAQSHVDSGVALGESGAQLLTGKGDCLVKTEELQNIERMMGAFIDEDEVDRIVNYAVEHNEGYFDMNAWNTITSRCSMSDSDNGSIVASDVGGLGANNSSIDDNLIMAALRLGFKYGGNLSISNIQRSLNVGFNRAGKVLNVLFEKNYVDSNKTGNQNKLLITKEKFKEIFGQDVDGA